MNKPPVVLEVSRSKIFDLKRKKITHELACLGATPTMMVLCLKEMGIYCSKGAVIGWVLGREAGKPRKEADLKVVEKEVVAMLRIARKMPILEIARITRFPFVSIFNFITREMATSWIMGKCQCGEPIVYSKHEDGKSCVACMHPMLKMIGI